MRPTPREITVIKVRKPQHNFSAVNWVCSKCDKIFSPRVGFCDACGGVVVKRKLGL